MIYKFICNNCGKSFSSYSIESNCPSCGSTRINMIGESNSPQLDMRPSLYGKESTSSDVLEKVSKSKTNETTTFHPSSSILLVTEDGTVPDHIYSCHNCGYQFVTNNDMKKCSRCGSTKIDELGNNSYSSIQSGGNSTANGDTSKKENSKDKDNDSFLDKTLDAVEDAADWVGDKLVGAGEVIVDAVSGVVDIAKDIFESVGDFFSSLGDSFSELLDSFSNKDEDYDDFLKSFKNSSNADNSDYMIYGGAYGTFDEEGKPDDAITQNLAALGETSGEIAAEPIDVNIFGLPLYYNAFADPCRTAFSDSILYDLPVVYIIPGKPKVNRKLIDASGSKIVDLDEYYDKTNGDTENADGFSFGILNPKNSGDLQYYTFKSNYSEYWKYLQYLTSYVHSWLTCGYSDTFEVKKYNISNEIKNKYTEQFGLAFYADRSTTVSESASNSYSTSRIADTVNEQSGTIREASTIGKYSSFSQFAANIAQNVTNLFTSATTAVDSLKSFEGVLTKTANSLMKVVNGAQLDFPEMWQDSKFDRSYSLSFRFYSPYGDRLSIEKYVYTPFLALLALVLPRQDQAFSYVEPFLVKVDAPGWFSVNCGVITSMTINKGGSDNLWTSDNLPRLIEVNLEIQDLYPALKQLSKNSMAKYNRNLSTYLENMSGIRAESLSLSTLFNFKVNKFLSNSIINTWDERLENKFSDWQYNMKDWVANMFR